MNPITILDLLPSSARLIAEIIGHRATLSLAEKCYERSKSTHYSVNLYIPKKIPRNHWLTACVGLKLSTRLQEKFGGELLSMPKCKAIQRSVRNQKVIALQRAGKTVEETSQQFNISGSTLVRIMCPVAAQANRERAKQRAAEVRAEKKLSNNSTVSEMVRGGGFRYSEGGCGPQAGRVANNG